MRHLKCICFVRPTPETIQSIVNELREPKYGEYAIYFSNIVKKSSLERMAEADDHEIVKSVQEFYGDYLAITKDLFSICYGKETPSIFGSERDSWNMDVFEKATEGILALLLLLKKKPLIRYERNSAMSKKLATEIQVLRPSSLLTQYQISTESQLFDFRKTDTPPILLILDRRNDPVTPLLTQWTYQAMVHDLLTITNGRVSLATVPDVRPELREIVLSPDQDPFFSKNMYLNFGDLGANVKDYVDQFQTKTKSTQQIDSIADMKRFVEDYPEFRRLSGNVSKHVTLISELSRRVEGGRLLEVSELEQSLACGDQHNADLKVLTDGFFC
jgi:vacuolar protein sorting-associated protein 45